MAEPLVVSEVTSRMERFLQNLGTIICSHRRWSDSLCSRRCFHDHPHQTLEKETLQYTPQLVKTVAREIMKVESSKQIRSQTCCSVTTDRSHLVAPAVSTDYPHTQEDAHRRLSEEEQRAFDLANEEERETARTIVSRFSHGTWPF